MLHEDTAVRMWWGQRAAGGDASRAEAVRQCLLCGRESKVVDKHDALQIAGCVISDVSLVTFNGGAFEKYGLERNDNAATCRECMTAYVEGLRRSINARYISARTGESVAAQNVRLSGDTIAVYWANVQDNLVGALSDLMYSPHKVRDLLSSPHRGQRPSKAADRFFCLVVSGAQGRAMLRRMHTGTLTELDKNFNAFFDARFGWR